MFGSGEGEKFSEKELKDMEGFLEEEKEESDDEFKFGEVELKKGEKAEVDSDEFSDQFRDEFSDEFDDEEEDEGNEDGEGTIEVSASESLTISTTVSTVAAPVSTVSAEVDDFMATDDFKRLLLPFVHEETLLTLRLVDPA
ncbi:hypothetical protein TL16_g07940 [Triparma laevis f. inornata]|uniref:Uncharacterized protein n=2 Tax=Triparma laevis TaxID=1534972 RepID=A0A9W7AED8_9STRA|nr:hypothetical protein TrLO_g1261 [Triparma laevis f. longispina]GMH78796.1 hypothetical protein TL16_g07940 [Triparma laevis f. inornata]